MSTLRSSVLILEKDRFHISKFEQRPSKVDGDGERTKFVVLCNNFRLNLFMNSISFSLSFFMLTFRGFFYVNLPAKQYQNKKLKVISGALERKHILLLYGTCRWWRYTPVICLIRKFRVREEVIDCSYDNRSISVVLCKIDIQL